MASQVITAGQPLNRNGTVVLAGGTAFNSTVVSNISLGDPDGSFIPGGLVAAATGANMGFTFLTGSSIGTNTDFQLNVDSSPANPIIDRSVNSKNTDRVIVGDTNDTALFAGGAGFIRRADTVFIEVLAGGERKYKDLTTSVGAFGTDDGSTGTGTWILGGGRVPSSGTI